MSYHQKTAENGTNLVKGASVELKWLQVYGVDGRSSFTAEKGFNLGFGRWTQLFCRESEARTSAKGTTGSEVLTLE